MRISRPFASCLLLVAAALPLATARADDLDVPGLFESAKASVAAQKYGHALADLQLILGEVGRMRTEALQKKLPAAPEGWTAEATEGGGGMGMFGLGAMSTAKRRYTKGESSMELELTADAPMLLASVQGMIQMAAMSGGRMKVVMVKGRKCVLELEEENKSGKLTVLLNTPNCMLKLEGRGITKADLVDVFGGALDLDTLEKTIAD